MINFCVAVSMAKGGWGEQGATGGLIAMLFENADVGVGLCAGLPCLELELNFH
jgi:hypothetical protein